LTDPTGHWSFSFSTSSLIQTLSQGVDPAFAAFVYDGTASYLDAGAWILDAGAVAISADITIAGTAVAGPAGTLVGAAAGEFVAAPLVLTGNIIASVASASSIASDILTGDTSIEYSGEITESSFTIHSQGVLGPDTQVAEASFTAGWTIPTSYASLTVQSAVVAYDANSALQTFDLPHIDLSEYIKPYQCDVFVKLQY